MARVRDAAGLEMGAGMKEAEAKTSQQGASEGNAIATTEAIAPHQDEAQ